MANHDDLYIVDNVDEERTVQHYLAEWCGISKQIDVATGYFDIGGLLCIDSRWQLLDKMRIILGDEVTKPTKAAFDEAVVRFVGAIRASVDEEQKTNDFLVGVPAIIEAIRTRKIECRVYQKGRFHAKAYITHFNDAMRASLVKSMHVPAGYALVGSSNFTRAGLTKNVELNVQLRDDVDQLQAWYEERWEESVDISDAVLKVLEGNCREFSPYEVYLRSMYEFFKSHEETVTEWELNESKVYPGLSQYQRDGYNNLVEIANRYNGAFLCDGVGLGKTYVGMMLIERFVKKERKNVVLIVPASARESVWEVTIKKLVPEILDGFFSFKIINHTDLLREGYENLMEQIAEQAEVVIIDEAHHFRSRESQRYRKLYEMMGRGLPKRMFMLTATPINNSFLDLQHLIELFTQRREDYFVDAPLNIHSLVGHFRVLEKSLEALTDETDVEKIKEDAFSSDPLVKTLVVQRSRAYVKKSLTAAEGARVLFSERQAPIVANYSLAKTYGRLIDDFIRSFEKVDPRTGRKVALLNLAIYSPYEVDYFKGDRSKIDSMVLGRHNQIVNLIRMLFLKRFESSAAAFEETCVRVYARLAKFVKDNREAGDKRAIDRLTRAHADIRERVEKVLSDMGKDLDEFEDGLPDYVWDVEDNLSKEDFDLNAMIADTLWDMERLADFIRDIAEISPEDDDKLLTLRQTLKHDVHLKDKKVIIFTEYSSTARYLKRELERDGSFSGIYELDGQTKCDRHAVLQRFAPYYNDKTSATLSDPEIRILIATDVLAEGLNLQDASCLINYDIHWNPVRLMQRIGRVDRRRNAEIEAKLLADHPELAPDRAKAFYWNFLPPAELERLLALYQKVSKKTLRISKTFGIEGRKLLTPEDDYEALKDFNSQYEGTPSEDEEMSLAYQQLLQDNPNYLEQIPDLPKKMFSGKRNEGGRSLFFCYELPVKHADGSWSSGSGDGLFRWFLLDPRTGKTLDSAHAIWTSIRCDRDEPRYMPLDAAEFSTIRRKMESYINRAYMRSANPPIGVNPRLVTWMSLG